VLATTAEAMTAWGTVVLAVGTTGTLIVALRQIAVERRERLLLDRRTAIRKHRRQATVVSAWYAGTVGGTSYIEMTNQSEQPVYEVVVSLAFVQGAAPRTTQEWMRLHNGTAPYTRSMVALPPGTFRVEFPSGWGALTARPGAEIGFTDANGVSWVRRADGKLEELATNAIDAFGLSRPVDFIAPGRPSDGARPSI